MASWASMAAAAASVPEPAPSQRPRRAAAAAASTPARWVTRLWNEMIYLFIRLVAAAVTEDGWAGLRADMFIAALASISDDTQA